METNNNKECPHCKFIQTLGDCQSNREYWIITEIFVYLHSGCDHCGNGIFSENAKAPPVKQND